MIAKGFCKCHSDLVSQILRVLDCGSLRLSLMPLMTIWSQVSADAWQLWREQQKVSDRAFQICSAYFTCL